jgi:UDP-N-acetylmuramoyl-L-alanyl-D-glutamate--2,6-diaminopimelate ligase
LLLTDLVTPHINQPGDTPANITITGIDITGIAADSRAVVAGDLFFALAGSRADGRSFVDAAINSGASAIVTDMRPLDGALKNVPVPVLQAENPRHALADAASRFWPRQPGMIAAVTGTNGKTSSVEFLRQIWKRVTWDSASIGTLGMQGIESRDMEGTMMGLAALTTPDAISLHPALQKLSGAGVTHLAIEASSHGLDQHRLDGLKVHIAGFTNLSRDHLDHHPDMESYFMAKSRLFTELLMPGGTAVINIDDPYGVRLADMLRDDAHQEIVVLTIGETETADFHIQAITPMDFGLEIVVSHRGMAMQIPVALAGKFQAMNAMTAAVMAHASGLALHDSLGALAYVSGAEGRMQMISGHPAGLRVVIDYAHTPDALRAALAALRLETGNRLAVLFGAGGERDPGKRPMMGAVAAELADLVFVTDDNPRSEPPEAIRRDILAACPDAQEISDRAEAITTVLGQLGHDDVLLIAGKGHESFQLVGDETLPFSDASVVRNAISDLVRASKQRGAK